MPTSSPCLCSQTPSHLLCAQLCPADSPSSRAWSRSTAVYTGVMQQVRATLLNLESCYRFSKARVFSSDTSRFFHLSVEEVWRFSTVFRTESSHLKILTSPASSRKQKAHSPSLSGTRCLDLLQKSTHKCSEGGDVEL